MSDIPWQIEDAVRRAASWAVHDAAIPADERNLERRTIIARAVDAAIIEAFRTTITPVVRRPSSAEPLPSLSELERLLQSDDGAPVHINLDGSVTPLSVEFDANVERLKACEHIADGDEGWEALRDLCPSTAAVARLQDRLRGGLRREVVEECARVADAWERKASHEGDNAPTKGAFVHALSAEATAHGIAFDIRALSAPPAATDREDSSNGSEAVAPSPTSSGRSAS